MKSTMTVRTHPSIHPSIHRSVQVVSIEISGNSQLSSLFFYQICKQLASVVCFHLRCACRPPPARGAPPLIVERNIFESFVVSETEIDCYLLRWTPFVSSKRDRDGRKCGSEVFHCFAPEPINFLRGPWRLLNEV